MKRYIPKEIEPKWQDVWAKTKLYEVKEDPKRKKIYATPMLPYPSGTGLHVGHVLNYSIADAVARYYRQRGFNVMSNMGWDAFGLPAENYAIKTGTPPQETIKQNLQHFKNQLVRTGMSYDWSREINTSDPDYYRWTQWIFIQLFKAGLAYQADSLQWWCPECQTVLADEQVIGGTCWRHDETPVIKKQLKQWFFKITDYADTLLDGLDNLDWPENIKTMQRNWIGRSEGAEIEFVLDGKQAKTATSIRVFTTRPDTIFGATFMVLAPEHPLLKTITTKEQTAEVESYITTAQKVDSISRMDEKRPKTGVPTGAYAINPATKQPIPVWVADYVLMDYGHGAIMAVPAHDQRDYEFANNYGLEIISVIDPTREQLEEHQPVTTIDHKNNEDYLVKIERNLQATREKINAGKMVYSNEGLMTNSGKYDGMNSAEARDKIVADLAKAKQAKEKVNYRIHDWLISRQRYWGAPIPIVHCQKCGAQAVDENDLPVVLPEVKNFAPTGGSTSVLADVPDWVNTTCTKCGGSAKRETDTMDGYACSSWYMFRYTDANNSKQAWDPKKANYWFPIDFYFGGDHAVSHLLYFRFWSHFFAEQGLIDKDKAEPVKKLVYNGYINAPDGAKMSKSKGNVIDPLEIIDSGYGADALRMFELFIGPYDQDASWNPSGVPGTYRFLQRVWGLFQEYLEAKDEGEPDNLDEIETELSQVTNRTIKKVTDDLERLSFNTAIAGLMEFINSANKIKERLAFNSVAWTEALTSFLQLLAPFAPHISEELWHQMGADKSIHISGWPAWDEAMVKSATVTIVVQINGKVRANLELEADIDEKSMVEAAKKDSNVVRYLEAGELIKTVTVPGKLVSFVVK